MKGAFVVCMPEKVQLHLVDVHFSLRQQLTKSQSMFHQQAEDYEVQLKCAYGMPHYVTIQCRLF